MTLFEEVAKLQRLAVQTDSYAYRFFRRGDLPEFDEQGVDPDAPLVMVYVTPDGQFTVTGCDRAGRPLGGEVPAGDGVPFIHGQPEVPPEPQPGDRRRGERRRGERRRWFRRG